MNTRRLALALNSLVDTMLHTLRWTTSFFHPPFASSARPRSPRRQTKLYLEVLEGRIVPSTDTFTNLAGGSWSTGSNWSLERPPTTGDAVSIPALMGGATVNYSGPSVTISSLALDGTFNMGGSLTVTGSVSGTGTMNLLGRLSQAVVAREITIRVPLFSSPSLDAVTLNGSMVAGDWTVAVTNGLILNGTITLGTGTQHGGGGLTFINTQTLSGIGTVTFTPFSYSMSSSNSLIVQHTGPPATLTIADGITIGGEGGLIGGFSQDTITNQGTISVSTPTGPETLLNMSIGTTGHFILSNGATARPRGGTSPLTNAGTVTIGDRCSLSFGSLGYVQTETGRLEVAIGRPPDGSYRIYNGNPSLAGTLAATYVNGFTPVPGDSYGIIYGTHTGSFDTVTGGHARYTPASVFLDIAADDTTLTPTSLAWDSAQGGADFGYQVSNSPVLTTTGVALYWSRSTQFADAIGGAVYAMAIPVGTAIGSYGPFNVPASTLGTPPVGAAYLLQVTDPANALGHFSEATNVKALVIPDILVEAVSTADSRSVTIEYDVHGQISQPFQIGIFRSPTATFDPEQNEPIASVMIGGANETVGHHSIEVELVQGNLWPGFHPFKYVLAVADPDHSLVGYTVNNDAAHYRNYVIGALVPGFDPTAWGQDTPADWVLALYDSSFLSNYDDVIPFSWASAIPSSQAIIDAGHALTSQVLGALSGFGQLAPNDVVDVHLIGHSRGAVVISLAMQSLVESPIPQLQHGYMKMTLLDPHPANLDYGWNADFILGSPFLVPYLAFEALVQDPPVVVPARVNEVEHLWQQNPYSDDLPLGETILNLWGLSPASIQYDDPSFTQRGEFPLTGLDGVGHSEVHDYYQQNFGPPMPPFSAARPGGKTYGSGFPLTVGPGLLFELTSSYSSEYPAVPPAAAWQLPPNLDRLDWYLAILPTGSRTSNFSRPSPDLLAWPLLEGTEDAWAQAAILDLPKGLLTK